MIVSNEVIEELHLIRNQLLEDAQGDLALAIKHAHHFANSFGLPVSQGQPRRPAGWMNAQQQGKQPAL